MQITHVEVTPVELRLSPAFRSGTHRADTAGSVFVRIETRDARVAWGCAAFDPALTGETMDQVTNVCHACADRSLDLNPLNTEYALSELADLTEGTPLSQVRF